LLTDGLEHVSQSQWFVTATWSLLSPATVSNT